MDNRGKNTREFSTTAMADQLIEKIDKAKKLPVEAGFPELADAVKEFLLYYKGSNDHGY